MSEQWKGVDPQVEVAAREMTPAQKAQPEWLWYDNGEMSLSFGRWGSNSAQAPYIRADLAVPDGEPVGWISRNALPVPQNALAIFAPIKREEYVVPLYPHPAPSARGEALEEVAQWHEAEADRIEAEGRAGAVDCVRAAVVLCHRRSAAAIRSLKGGGNG